MEISPGCAGSVQAGDMVLGQGKRIWGVAGDDAHLNPEKRFYSDAGLAWVEIWAEELSTQPVLHALRSGAFCSPQRPVFHSIEVDEHCVRVTCSPVRQVRWRTYGHVGFVDYAPENETLACAALPDG